MRLEGDRLKVPHVSKTRVGDRKKSQEGVCFLSATGESYQNKKLPRKRSPSRIDIKGLRLVRRETATILYYLGLVSWLCSPVISRRRAPICPSLGSQSTPRTSSRTAETLEWRTAAPTQGVRKMRQENIGRGRDELLNSMGGVGIGEEHNGQRPESPVGYENGIDSVR